MLDRPTLKTLDAAHRVLTGSFLAYLADARPYIGPTDVALARRLDAELAELGRLTERIADSLVDGGGETRPGEFSIAYTNANDVAIGYALRRAAEGLVADTQRLAELIATTNNEAVRGVIDEAQAGLAGIRRRLNEAAERSA